MMLTATPIACVVIERAREAALRLEEHPFYARLLDGSASREEYAAWLVQMHKYVRHTSRSLRGLVVATAGAAGDELTEALHEYAVEELQGEAGHDELIVRDLAALWGITPDAALGRIERAPTCPAAASWQAQLDTLLARFPEGIVGFAVTLETIASLHADRTRHGLLERDPSLAGAVSFLEAHRAEVEEAHGAEGAAQLDALSGARARSSAFFYASAALTLYEGIVWYLHERFAGRAVHEVTA
ncbi:MAG: iron-containing redox enzyme family protein [Planctomycetes bacterium]|nr:iron-containing redox enzyme family protein [Planctomycetota bacterium]